MSGALARRALRTRVTFFSGTSKAPVVALQVLDGLLQELLQLARAVGLAVGGVRCALRQQQVEVLVEAADGRG